MKLTKIDEVWNCANSLLSNVFGLLSSRNFATMAIWHNGSSSLLPLETIFSWVLFTYICLQGGWDGSVHLNSGEVYEPEIDQWSFIAPASTARWDAGISVESDKIYIVGGCDRNALCTLETECYDPEKNKWSKVASLPVATHGLKCCTIQLPHKFSK